MRILNAETFSFAGMVDGHVHARQPGNNPADNFLNFSRAAIAGGVVQALDMPNNTPYPTANPEALGQKFALAGEGIYCDTGFYFAATGKASKYFHQVRNKVFGYKMYLSPTTGNLLIGIDEAEEVIRKLPQGKLLIAHVEGAELLEKLLRITGLNNTPLHVAHVSLEEEVKLLDEALDEKKDISLGITSHHLMLTEADARTLGPLGMMKPPLGTRKDRDALRKSLIKDGNRVMVESDHAPHTIDAKMGDNPPFGVPGVETLLPITLEVLKYDIKRFIEVTHENPRRRFAVPVPYNTQVIAEIGDSYPIMAESLHYLCGWTPFEGMDVRARVTRVDLRGSLIYKNGEFTQDQVGRVIKPLS